MLGGSDHREEDDQEREDVENGQVVETRERGRGENKER